ncbi:MAG: alpha/beta hydrolase [Planctomycetota bacterium]
MVLKLDDSFGSRRDVVIVTHGLFAGRRSMQPLCRAVVEAGYECVNWGYPSLSGSIAHHAAQFSELLREHFERPDVHRVHLIAHSMGGIVARAALSQSRLESRLPAKCGRLVMLAPPNRGSHLTRMPLGPLSCWFPQVRELSEDPESLVNQLPEPRRMHVAVIAAARDFVVSVQSTRLACQRDHHVLPTTHQRLAAHPDAIRMALQFVRCGRLSDSSSSATVRFDPKRGQPSAPVASSRNAA